MGFYSQLQALSGLKKRPGVDFPFNLIIPTQVQIAFLKFDMSGDDRLDYREFCEMIRKHKEEKK